MRLEKSKIALAIKLLCESSGIRQTSRIVGIHQDTVLKILKISGTIARQLMEDKAQNLKCEVVAADEVHSWVYARDYAVKDKVYMLCALLVLLWFGFSYYSQFCSCKDLVMAKPHPLLNFTALR